MDDDEPPPEPLGSAQPPGIDPRMLQSNERTLLAWVRTSITLMAFGFVVARSAVLLNAARNGETPQEPIYAALGSALILMGTAIIVAAVVRFYRARRALLAERSPAHGVRIEIALSAALALLGLALGVYVIVD